MRALGILCWNKSCSCHLYQVPCRRFLGLFKPLAFICQVGGSKNTSVFKCPQTLVRRSCPSKAACTCSDIKWPRPGTWLVLKSLSLLSSRSQEMHGEQGLLSACRANHHCSFCLLANLLLRPWHWLSKDTYIAFSHIGVYFYPIRNTEFSYPPGPHTGKKGKTPKKGSTE